MTIDIKRSGQKTNKVEFSLEVKDLCHGCHVRRRKHILLTMREKTKKRYNRGLKTLVLTGVKPADYKCRKMAPPTGWFCNS